MSRNLKLPIVDVTVTNVTRELPEGTAQFEPAAFNPKRTYSRLYVEIDGVMRCIRWNPRKKATILSKKPG